MVRLKIKIMSNKLDFPIYEFRPLNEGGRKLLRYNGGNWIEDDGEYDLCFITDDNKDAPFSFYIDLPYRKNQLWSWCKDMNWGRTDIANHPNGNAWHYMTKDGTSEMDESWDRGRHPNIVAGDLGSSILAKKNGCANGRGVQFYVNDIHILKGLVRYAETKETVKIPDVFKCKYCGEYKCMSHCFVWCQIH